MDTLLEMGSDWVLRNHNQDLKIYWMQTEFQQIKNNYKVQIS